MVDRHAEDRAAQDKTAQDKAPQRSVAKTQREKIEARNKEKIERFEQEDGVRRQQASGAMTEETRDQLLALGEDVTRASPDPAQVLPDAEPGLTTTTGSYKTPIDPTTAAVPAPESSEVVQRMQGVPTMGSEGHGQPEKLFDGPKERPLIQDEDEQSKARRPERDRERDRTERDRERPERGA